MRFVELSAIHAIPVTPDTAHRLRMGGKDPATFRTEQEALAELSLTSLEKAHTPFCFGRHGFYPLCADCTWVAECRRQTYDSS